MPQGLKPHFVGGWFGTPEGVPLREPEAEASLVSSALFVGLKPHANPNVPRREFMRNVWGSDASI